MISPEELEFETNWFLKKITAFNAQSIVGINEHMVKLFYDAAQKISDCVDRNEIANLKETSENADALFDIDVSCYRYHRSIMCTICNVHIDIKKSQYLAHVNCEEHKRNASAMTNGAKSDPGISGPSASTSSNGNDFQATDNVTTNEYFHLPTPMPHATKSATPHSMTNADSSSNHDIGKSMNDLNLNGADTNAERQANSTLNGHDISMTSKNFDSIRNDIKVLFPRSKVYFYGSQIYELTDDQSDLNVYIDLDGESYNVQRGRKTLNERKAFVEHALKQDRSRWKNVTSDHRLLRYPLVRATHIHHGMNCTFSFNTGLFVEASHLIKDYLNAWPLARSMVHFLKNWQREMRQDGTVKFAFSTHQMTILVIWYFQFRGHLPSVKSLQSSSKKLHCADAQVDYKKPIVALKPAFKQLHHFLLDFFNIFGNQYDPQKHVISPHYGKLLKRNYTSNIDADNLTLCKFIHNANELIWKEPHAYMLVQDIYLQSSLLNVTADISAKALSTFRANCKLTAEFLRESNQTSLHSN